MFLQVTHALQPEPVDVVRAGLKDGAIVIAPNGDIELSHESTLQSREMRTFAPPPVPSAAPPPTPSALPSASQLVTVAIVSSSSPSEGSRGSSASRGSESSLKVRPPLLSHVRLTLSSEEKQRDQL